MRFFIAGLLILFCGDQLYEVAIALFLCAWKISDQIDELKEKK